MSRLIEMRGIVKRFNEGLDSELTVIPGLDFSVDEG